MSSFISVAPLLLRHAMNLLANPPGLVYIVDSAKFEIIIKNRILADHILTIKKEIPFHVCLLDHIYSGGIKSLRCTLAARILANFIQK